MKTKMLASLLAAMAIPAWGQVKMEAVSEKIPTYQIGNPEVDPIFFTGRVYQGAEGYIYPYPLYDVLTEKVVDQSYNVLKLGNEYVNIAVLPGIGGRIFSATDKTNDYHFFYTQTGVKPALIGMLGAWLSGGVEWNIPDHHRATTYLPTNWTMKENKDGSKTIWVGETELRHRLKWSVGVSVYPNRSWVEAKIMVTNPTQMIQSMLYWANVSVHCDEHYQVIFPPDVQFGVDHHKVYFTNWPTGEAVIGSGKQVDLSRWANYTGDSRSIFAWGSEMEFLAGYDYAKDAGTVHVANRHVVPGKKFFLWGNNPNGHMWNKILSDKDGHYLELMVGAYSDNQPDYSWINPGESREFSQIWYPIKGIKGCKNATMDAAVNFEPADGGMYRIGFCSTTEYKQAKVVVKHQDNVLMEKQITIDPDHFFLDQVKVPADVKVSDLYAALYDAEGNLLVDYRPVELDKGKPLPKVIDGTKPVKEYKTNEELYLAGLRVDQFNNARLDYMDFYREALERDSMDARVNIEVGKHFIRQGEWKAAEKHLLRAQARLSHDYTRVKDAEALYYLGYLYHLTGDCHQAENNYWAATWTPDYKHPAFYGLAVLAMLQNDYGKALDMVTQSLYVGQRDIQAQNLKAYILRKLGRTEEAKATIDYVQSIDPLDYWSTLEKSFIEKGDASVLQSRTKDQTEGLVAVQEFLEMVNNYLSVGGTEEAQALIDQAVALGNPFAASPLVYYYKAYVCLLEGNRGDAGAQLEKANSLSHINQYPLRIEEVKMFDTLTAAFADNAFLHYHYGNLLYYIGQKDHGLAEWTRSTELDGTFAVALRNVGFAYGQKGEWQKAMGYYDRAIKANPDDALLFTESDKIYESANVDAAARLKRLESNIKTVMKHDDAVMRLLSLYNVTGKYDKAIQIMHNRHFHLWEGGGQIHGIYADSHMLKGMTLLAKKNYQKAIQEFDLATQYPANLEVAPSYRGGYEAKAYYLAGEAYEGMKQAGKAQEFYQKAAEAKCPGGLKDLSYYQVKALQKVGKNAEASAALKKMEENLSRIRQNAVDSYAKFGDSNKNEQESNIAFYSALIHLLKNEPTEAQSDLRQAIQLNPGNIWAGFMSK